MIRFLIEQGYDSRIHADVMRILAEEKETSEKVDETNANSEDEKETDENNETEKKEGD